MRATHFKLTPTRLRWLLLACYAIAVAWLSLEPALGRELGQMDKSAHFATYLAFAMVAFVSTRNRRQYLVACALIILFSIALEYTQKMVPGRTFSLLDIRANALGLAAGLVLALVVGRQRINRLLALVTPTSLYTLEAGPGATLEAGPGATLPASAVKKSAETL
ncbi:MAG: VanZ family protein [Anaerolineae bacterium]